MTGDRRAKAIAAGQAAAARATGSVDQGLTRAQPVLTAAAKALALVGRLVAATSVVGAVGAVLLIGLGVRSFGWLGLLFGFAALAPLAGWRVGRRAVRGAGLLGDPRRIMAAVKASGEAGRSWLEHLAAMGRAAKSARILGLLRSAVGAGRSLWQAVGPEVEGAEELRSLALWPRTLTMVIAGLASPLLLVVALLWALLVVAF